MERRLKEANKEKKRRSNSADVNREFAAALQAASETAAAVVSTGHPGEGDILEVSKTNEVESVSDSQVLATALACEVSVAGSQPNKLHENNLPVNAVNT